MEKQINDMAKTTGRNTGQALTGIIKAYRVVHEKHEKKRFQGRHRQNVFSLMPILSIVEGGAFESGRTGSCCFVRNAPPVHNVPVRPSRF